MKFTFTSLFVASLILTGCATENVKQEAFNRDLVDGIQSMNALRALDKGNTNQVKQIETVRIAMAVDGLSHFGPEARPAPAEKQVELALARDLLDYLSKHRADLDPRSPTIEGAIQGLQTILTEPDDVKQLKALSDYLAEIAQMRSVAP